MSILKIFEIKTLHYLSVIPLGFVNKIPDKFSLQNFLLNFISNNEINFKNSARKGWRVYKEYRMYRRYLYSKKYKSNFALY